MIQLILEATINKNLIESQIALNLSMKEVKTLIVNSFKASFLKEEKEEDVDGTTLIYLSSL